MTTQVPSNVPPIDDWNQLLAGRVAVVTGGGDGIGGAVRPLFAQHGAHVEIAEIDPERAERVVADITEAGGSARAHVVDVRTEDGVAALAEAVLAEHRGAGAREQRRRLPPARALPEVGARVVGRHVPPQLLARRGRHPRVPREP